MFWVFVMNFCFMCAVPLVKQAVYYGHPLLVVAVRMFTGSILLGYLYSTGQRSVRLPFAQWNWWFILQVALITVYAVNVGESLALEYLSATEVSLLWALVPLITTVIGCIWYGHRLHCLQWIGIAICTGSMAFLVVAQAGCLSISGGYRWCIGMMQLFISVCSAAWGYFLLHRLVSEGYGVLLGNAITMGIGGTLSALTWLLLYGDAVQGIQQWAPFVGYSMLAGIIVNGGALSLQSWLVTKHSPIVLAISGFIGPIGSACLSVWVLGEAWKSAYGIAVACMLVGLSIFYAHDIRRMLGT